MFAKENKEDKDGMRTDDINALAGQRADKKGGARNKAAGRRGQVVQAECWLFVMRSSPLFGPQVRVFGMGRKGMVYFLRCCVIF